MTNNLSKKKYKKLYKNKKRKKTKIFSAKMKGGSSNNKICKFNFPRFKDGNCLRYIPGTQSYKQCDEDYNKDSININYNYNQLNNNYDLITEIKKLLEAKPETETEAKPEPEVKSETEPEVKPETETESVCIQKDRALLSLIGVIIRKLNYMYYTLKNSENIENKLLSSRIKILIELFDICKIFMNPFEQLGGKKKTYKNKKYKKKNWEKKI